MTATFPWCGAIALAVAVPAAVPGAEPVKSTAAAISTSRPRAGRAARSAIRAAGQAAEAALRPVARPAEVATYGEVKYADILRRIVWSGSEPAAAPRLSAPCLGLRVPGVTQVTAGCARIHFTTALGLSVPRGA